MLKRSIIACVLQEFTEPSTASGWLHDIILSNHRGKTSKVSILTRPDKEILTHSFDGTLLYSDIKSPVGGLMIRDNQQTFKPAKAQVGVLLYSTDDGCVLVQFRQGMEKEYNKIPSEIKYNNIKGSTALSLQQLDILHINPKTLLHYLYPNTRSLSAIEDVLKSVIIDFYNNPSTIDALELFKDPTANLIKAQLSILGYKVVVYCNKTINEGFVVDHIEVTSRSADHPPLKIDAESINQGGLESTVEKFKKEKMTI